MDGAGLPAPHAPHIRAGHPGRRSSTETPVTHLLDPPPADPSSADTLSAGPSAAGRSPGIRGPRRTRPPAHAARLLTALLLVAAGGALSSQPAGADDSPTSWQVQPSGPEGPGTRPYFVYDSAPGEYVEDVVGITNYSDRDITVRVFGTDALNTPSGDFDLLATAEEPVDVGSWVTLQAQEVTVAPRQRVDIPFRIDIPANATPGDHVGAVVTSLPTVRTDAQGQQVLVDARVAARIYLTVDGELDPGLSVQGLRLDADATATDLRGRVTATFDVSNDGNVRLGGTHVVRLTGPLGLPLGESAGVELPELLPGNSITQTVVVDGVWSALQVEGVVELQPVDRNGRLAEPLEPRYESAEIGVVPWAWLVGLAVLVAAVVVALKLRGRRRARAGRAGEAEPAGPDARVGALTVVGAVGAAGRDAAADADAVRVDTTGAGTAAQDTGRAGATAADADEAVPASGPAPDPSPRP